MPEHPIPPEELTAGDPVQHWDHDPERNDVFDRGGGWYWWDETWANAYGPFLTRQSAQEACTKYAENEL